MTEYRRPAKYMLWQRYDGGIGLKEHVAESNWKLIIWIIKLWKKLTTGKKFTIRRMHK